NGYYRGPRRAAGLVFPHEPADLALGVEGGFAEGGGGSLEVVGGDAAVEVCRLAAEGEKGLEPVGLGARGCALRLEAVAVDVPRAHEVCARAVNGRVEFFAVLDPGEREQDIFEDAEGRARDLSGQK